MIRTTIAAALAGLLFAAPFSFAGTTPAANGLGALVPDNNGRSRGMGGAGIAMDDGRNLLLGNPALISTFTSASWGFGVLYDRNVLNPRTGAKNTFAKTDPTLIRFVLPLRGGVGIGWGIAPYTRADVKIALPGTGGGTYTDTMKSSGGINLSTLGLAGAFKNVRAGAALDYYFGMNQEDWTRDFHGAEGLVNSTETLKRKYRGYGMTLGALARVKSASFGVGYSTGSTLTETDTLHPAGEDNPEITVMEGKIEIPSTLRLGTSFGFSRRVTAAADIAWSDWSSAARTAKEKAMYADTCMFAAGVRFVPSVRPSAKYLSTMPLSAGFRIGTLYYKSWPTEKKVREAAFALGVEFPFRNGMGGLFTSCEIGKRGDAGSNGWDELFLNVGVSLSGAIK